MREATRKALDVEQRKEKNAVVLGGSIALLCAKSYGALFYPFSTTTVYGKAKSIAARQTDEGSKAIIAVELNSGRTVVARYPTELNFEKGKTVELLETKSLIGNRGYRFVQYANKAHNE